MQHDTSFSRRAETSRLLVLTALCLGVLVAQTDSMVANLAIREIDARLHAEVAALQWVIDAYNLAYALLLLTGGLLGDFYGRRRGFIAGVALFLIGSLVCGLAPDAGTLIVGRAVAGAPVPRCCCPAPSPSCASCGPIQWSGARPSASGRAATVSRSRLA